MGGLRTVPTVRTATLRTALRGIKQVCQVKKRLTILDAYANVAVSNKLGLEPSVFLSIVSTRRCLNLSRAIAPFASLALRESPLAG
jgi:hypothetical protein